MKESGRPAPPSPQWVGEGGWGGGREVKKGGAFMRVPKILGLAVLAAGLCVPAAAQDRARTKEVVVAFAAEPRSLLPNTIVDWTTNDQVEHMYDRLVDRDPKTYRPAPMLATGWKVVG